jgi:Zn-dependent protease/predicted transcriptional regulator
MRNIHLGSLFGIPIRLNVSFLIVLPLVAYLIGIQIAPLASILNQTWHAQIQSTTLVVGWMPWVLGILSAIGLFTCVIFHELGHSLVARRFGFGTESITLWFLGGVSSLSEIPEDWRQEFLVAIAGPFVSFILGGLCFGILVILPTGLNAVRFLVAYLSLLNIVLAVFNLLPGFPMDGGRILRSLLARTRSHARATEIAANVGKGMAVIFGIIGLLSFNIFLIGIALFVYLSATGEVVQETLSGVEGTTVSEIMTPLSELDTVPPDMNISKFFEQMFEQRHVGYPVVQDTQVIGVVTLDDAARVPMEKRDEYTVQGVMTRNLETVSADETVEEFLKEFQRSRVGRMFVVDSHSQIVGLVTRTDVMTILTISGR